MNNKRIEYTLLNGTIASASGIIWMSLAMSSLHSHYRYLPRVNGSYFPYSYAIFFSICTFTLFFTVEPKVEKINKVIRKVTVTWCTYVGWVILYGIISNIIINLGYETMLPGPQIISQIRFQGAIGLFLAIGCITCWPLFLLNLLNFKKST